MALEPESDLPPDLANEIAAMALFTDDALWSASETSLSPAQQHRLRQLTQSSQERRLTDVESSELESLLEQYHNRILGADVTVKALRKRIAIQYPDQPVLYIDAEQEPSLVVLSPHLRISDSV